MKRSDLKEPISKAVLYLVDHDPFISDSSPTKQPWQPKFQYQTSFVPSLILQSLHKLPQKEIDSYNKRLSSFLLRQHSRRWAFNYWARGSNEANEFPYPDDLDDTFCALIALYKQQPETIRESAMADVVRLLLATESTVGGPYRTWLVAKENRQWQDVDLAVNANIAYFLQLTGSSLPNLTDYLTEHILEDNFSSPYYPSAFPVYYYVARVCPVAARDQLAQTISKSRPSNALEIALIINALHELQPRHPQITALAKQLVALQQPDGSWPAQAFCLDPTRDGKKHYHGSPSLTTAFAIEALQRQALAPKVSQPGRNNSDRIYYKIIEAARQDIITLPVELSKQANNMLEAMIKADPKRQITTLPCLFSQSLKAPIQQPENFYVQLGLANLYGWMAYTIYDDFLDDEGQPLLLSVANWAMRSSLQLFITALPDEEFIAEVNQTFNVIDNANTWEIANCRWVVRDGAIQTGALPRYGQRRKLAERSLGHGLSLVAILQSSGAGLSSDAVGNIKSAFRHYLIARQLDDDTHDWQADLAAGRISYAVAVVLADAKSLDSNTQSVFWNQSLPKICRVMQSHINRAKQLLDENQLLTADNLLLQLLEGIEKSVQQTLQKQKQAHKFLKSYEKSAKLLTSS